VGQSAPLAPRAGDVEDGTDDCNHISRAKSSSWLGCGNQGFKKFPLTLGEVGVMALGHCS
jgi:hypothetical protein